MSVHPFIRSLAHRNFRLFFFSQSVSLIGSWMQHTAMSWLVYDLTRSSFLLGATLFLGQIPCLFLSPFVGVLTDRWDRRRVLYITQALAALQAFALAALAFSGSAEVWHLMALSLALGIGFAFDMPARQAFLTEMVTEPKDLPNAIAMGATMFNGARFIGPALAGLVLAEFSAGMCFLLNGLSFLPVFLALAAMRLPKREGAAEKKSLRDGFKEGLFYAWRFLPLRNILCLLCLGSFTAGAASVLLPEYTVSFLGGDARLLGWLGSAKGLGALGAALFLASRRTVLGHGLWIGGGIALMGLGLLLAPFAFGNITALLIFFLIGFGLVVHIAGGNAVIQTVSDADKRGRILGLYTMAIAGLMPIGELLNGFIARHFGATFAFVLMGSLALTAGLAFLAWVPALHRHVRPIYVKLKILPPV